MGYVFLFICFLKVPVGAMPESFGGYNFLLGAGCGKTHIAVLLSPLIRNPQKNICIFLAHTVALVEQVSYYL